MVTTYLCEMSIEQETHYESVIGLEVHVQMNTISKAYSSDGYSYGAAPNTQVCPISLGHPGHYQNQTFKSLKMQLNWDLHVIALFENLTHMLGKIISIQIFRKDIKLLRMRLQYALKATFG